MVNFTVFHFCLLSFVTKEQFFKAKKSIILKVYTLYICKELSKEIPKCYSLQQSSLKKNKTK